MVAPTIDFEVLQNAFSFSSKINNIFRHKKSKKVFTNGIFCVILDGRKFIGGIFGFKRFICKSCHVRPFFPRWALFL